MGFVAPFGGGATIFTPCVAPILAAIVNPDADGDYTVDWNDVVSATSYTLEEDDNALFTTPTVVYTGAASTFNVVGHADGTAYYRARANCSVWSNTVSTTVDIFNLYVDYKNGNDAWTGGIADPLKTLAHCLSVHAANGSKVGLLGSSADDTTYHRIATTITIALTGLTIKAAPGHTPVVVSSVAYSGPWVLTGGTTNVYETAEIVGPSYVYNGNTPLVAVASVALCDATPNSYYPDLGVKLHVNIGGGIPGTIEVIGGNFYGLTVNGDGNTVEDLIMKYWWQPSLNLVGDTIIDGCAFQSQPYFSVVPDFSGLRIAAGTQIIQGCLVDATVQTSAIGVVDTVNNVTVRNSVFSQGIMVLGGTGHLIDACTFLGCGDGVSTYAATAATGITVQHSLFVDCPHAGVVFGSATDPGDCIVHHNVFYHTYIHGANGYGVVFHNPGTGECHHNTFYNMTCGACVYFAPLAGALVVDCYNNIIKDSQWGFNHQSGAVTHNVDYSCLHGNVVDYTGVPAGANDVNADPLFTNAPAHIFTLQAGSPCLDAGLFVAGISEFGPPTDIGRWEI